MDEKGVESKENAPKNIERLEEISMSNSIKRKLEEEADEDDGEKIKIHDDVISLENVFDINSMDKETPAFFGTKQNDLVPLLDIEEL